MEQKLSKNFAEAYQEFAEWVEEKEKLLQSTCQCGAHGASQQSPTSNGSPKQLSSSPLINASPRATTKESIIIYHRKLQDEIEARGSQLHNELKRHLDLEEQSCNQQHLDDSKKLANRWYKLWLKSLEQLVIVERYRPCPIHYSTTATTTNKTPPQHVKLQQTITTSSPLQLTTRKSSSLRATPRKRPISYPNNNYTDRLEWDYKNTLMLTGCHKENGSHIDLDSVDEQITKNLTEFGENYELWLDKDDEIVPLDQKSSLPSSKKPDLDTAVVITPNSTNFSTNDVNCNLLMLTTPSSIFSVDASKCSQQEKPASYSLRFLGAFLFAIAAFLFSSLYTEPHHIHKSYYHSQPPV